MNKNIQDIANKIKEDGYMVSYLDCRTADPKQIEDQWDKTYKSKPITIKEYTYKDKIVMKQILFYIPQKINIESDNSMELYIHMQGNKVTDEQRKELIKEFEEKKNKQI